jgi:hypothetical protein
LYFFQHHLPPRQKSTCDFIAIIDCKTGDGMQSLSILSPSSFRHAEQIAATNASTRSDEVPLKSSTFSSRRCLPSSTSSNTIILALLNPSIILNATH